MNAPIEQWLVTKNAGLLFAYTPAYVARLARQNKVSGRKVGRAWLVERASLEKFCQQRSHRKAKRSRAGNFIGTIAGSQSDSVWALLRAQAPAIIIAVLVIGLGALGARTLSQPTLANIATNFIQNVSYSTANSFSAVAQSVASGARITYPAMRAAALALAHVYLSIGGRAYAAINSSLVAYRSLIDRVGVETFSLARATRDTLPSAPGLVANINLTLGAAVIDSTHAAIHADVMVAYALAGAAPESARMATTIIGNIGDGLARVTSRAPALTVALAAAVSARYLILVNETGRIAYERARYVRENIRTFFISSATENRSLVLGAASG